MVGGGDPLLPEILSPSSNLLLLVKTITHPAARCLCDSWTSSVLSGNLCCQLGNVVVRFSDSLGRLLVIHI